MSLDRRSTLELKASLLSKGVNFDMDLFRGIQREFYANQFGYDTTSANVRLSHRFPQVLQLGDEVIAALLRRENSPWNLRVEGQNVNLYKKDKFVRTLGLPERPPYFGRKLKDGTTTDSFIAVAGERTPGFFLYPNCYYFGEGKPCGFCSMKSTRKGEGKYMATQFSEANIKEATEIFQQTKWRDIHLISITMGTPATDEETREFVIKPIRWMYEALNPKLPIHLLAHPPNDLAMVEEFKAAGLTSIAFNLEVYNRALFEATCPGKASFYGYDKWQSALEEARRVFGDYRVFCGLVWGLEPPESTIQGHEYFLDRGIALASNIFHSDPRSVLSRHPLPSEGDIMQIAEAEAKLFKRFPRARTIFDLSMRSTLDWEVYRGDLE